MSDSGGSSSDESGGGGGSRGAAAAPRAGGAAARLRRDKPKKKKKWCEAEDARLRELVAAQGASAPVNWVLVSQGLQPRTASQCNARWKYYLRPGLRVTEPWEPAEDAFIAASLRVRCVASLQKPQRRSN